jgi:putative ABC transport system permease protein
VSGSEYEVMTWEEMMPDVVQHIKTDTGSMQIIIGILYLLVSFGIFSTLLMLMAERQYELGMLLAIGMSRMRIALMLLFEALITSLTGCFAGVAFSIPFVYYLNIHPLRFGGELAATYEKFGFEPIFPTSLNPEIFIRQGIIVLIISMILFMYPLVKIKSMKPVNAMRK